MQMPRIYILRFFPIFNIFERKKEKEGEKEGMFCTQHSGVWNIQWWKGIKGIGYFRGGFLYSLIKMTDELGSHVYKSQVGAACQGFTEGVKTFKLNKKVIFLQNSGRIY